MLIPVLCVYFLLSVLCYGSYKGAVVYADSVYVCMYVCMYVCFLSVLCHCNYEGTAMYLDSGYVCMYVHVYVCFLFSVLCHGSYEGTVVYLDSVYVYMYVCMYVCSGGSRSTAGIFIMSCKEAWVGVMFVCTRDFCAKNCGAFVCLVCMHL
jgi:hypothetical protein